jgi:hypothetical protein
MDPFCNSPGRCRDFPRGLASHERLGIRAPAGVKLQIVNKFSLELLLFALKPVLLENQ